MRHTRRTATFAVSVVLAPLLATAPSALASDEPAVDAPAITDFVEITDRYLEQRADSVTVSPAQVGTMAVPTTEAMSRRLVAEYRQLIALGAEYKQLDGGYTSTAVAVTPTGHFAWTQTTATLDVTEDTKLFHPADEVASGAPEAQECSLEHTLTFSRDSDGTWRLSSDRADTGSMPPSTYMAEPQLDLEIPEEDSSAPDETEDGKTETSSPNGAPGPRGDPKELQAVAGYDYNKMAAYANKHWKKNNGHFRTYGNDCTNFISQAMDAGGWGAKGGSLHQRRSNKYWFYGPMKMVTSYTWAGAENWYWFATKHSKRTYILANVKQLGKGDVLQAEFDRNNTINHTMIVTRRTISNSYLTYHTPSVHNRSLEKILHKYSKGWWYAHRI